MTTPRSQNFADRRELVKQNVIVLDEMEYVPASRAGAKLLFDLIGSAYKRQRPIATTNLPFENRAEVLGSERLTGAALDHLTDCCRIVELNGESYRLQDARRRRRSKRMENPSLAKAGRPRMILVLTQRRIFLVPGAALFNLLSQFSHPQ